MPRASIRTLGRPFRLGTLATTLGIWGLLAGHATPARADEAADHYNLALQYKRTGKTAEAIAECQKAIQLRPDYASAHLTLGNLYRSQADYEHAAGESRRP